MWNTHKWNSRLKLEDLRVGQTVRWENWGGKVEEAKIIALEEDIKHGEPGVDLDSGHWCYLDQIVRVVD